ncbi:DUF2225 domain-containing protein [Oscillospiraceae bacterium WX1]
MINLGAINDFSRIKKCPKGAVITGNGSGNIMFVVVKGEVGVYSGGKVSGSDLISTLGTGDLFADPALLCDKKAQLATVALSEAIILPIEKKSAVDFMQNEPALAFELIKDLCIRLDQASDTNKSLLLQHGAQQRNKKSAEQSAAPADPPPAADAPGQPRMPSLQGAFQLFPEGHGSYALPLERQETAFLMNKSYICPICKNSFSATVIRPSKLVLASTDDDMRSHYKGIEPLYHEVLTCPHCLYSALPDVFDLPDKSRQDILRELGTVKDGSALDFKAAKDTNLVFAGYYLALFCAPISFVKYQLVAGKLLYKLSRVYQDAGDAVMENATAAKALENYLYAYEKLGISPNQEQQVCILLGELYLKQNDLKNAIAFFSKAKANTHGTPVLKNHAEKRIYEIRETAAAQR